MVLSSVTLGLAAAVILLVYKYLIYPGWISPLASLPTANPLCSFTGHWMIRRCKAHGELKTLYAAHQHFGPIVRLGPSEVSVISQEGLDKIYTAGLNKHMWYEKTFYLYGQRNLVSTLEHKAHSAQKRMIAKLYTKSYLQTSRHMAVLSRRIIFERLGPLLQRYVEKGSDVNVVELFEWTGLDLVTAYLFGEACGTDFLRNQDDRERYFREWSKHQGGPCTTYAEEVCMNMCNAVLASERDEKRSSNAEPVVFSVLYDRMCAEAHHSPSSSSDANVLRRCASEMLDHIIATQETNTITWTYILYRLSLHPDLQQRLRDELLTLQPPVLTGGEDLPDPADVDRLPLLDAVVYETLRLHAANPARMRRVVPASGLHLHGYEIPPGTTVSTNAYCLHRNEEVFPQALEWIPERWLSSGENAGGKAYPPREEAVRWFWAFGSGPRMCIGRNFATQGTFYSKSKKKSQSPPLCCAEMVGSDQACRSRDLYPIQNEHRRRCRGRADGLIQLWTG